MSPFVLLLIACVVSLLIGGIPFGYLAGWKVLKDDIRNHGSGNIGATNVGRILGWKWGGLVLVLDAIKGLFPTAAAGYAATEWAPESWHLHVPVAAGICAIAGHMYPVYLKLRGGKGVATALGVVLILAPAETGIALAVFLVVFGITRIVALASMSAAIGFATAWLMMNHSQAWTSASASLTAFTIVVPLLIVWRHRSNIAKLITRKDPPLTESQTPQKPGD